MTTAEPPRAERRRRGPFGYGELRLIVLDMMAARPRHGYDFIKSIGDRMGGGYRPSPGVIYPTLSWLENAGYARRTAEGGRKLYRVTAEGANHLAANRDALAEIVVHMGGAAARGSAPDPVPEGMDAVKRALRMRFAHGPLDDAAVATIAAALRAAARTITETIPPASGSGAAASSVAEVATSAAQEHLVQLCAHFARRTRVRREANRGYVTFSIGTCELTAEPKVLRMRATAADAEALGRVEYVLERHLVRFALDEDLLIEWKPI